MNDEALLLRLLEMYATQDMTQLNGWEERQCVYCSKGPKYFEHGDDYPIDRVEHDEDCFVLKLRELYARVIRGLSPLNLVEHATFAPSLDTPMGLLRETFARLFPDYDRNNYYYLKLRADGSGSLYQVLDYDYDDQWRFDFATPEYGVLKMVAYAERGA